MSNKYKIRLKGTNCYLKNTSEKGINFTTDSKKAKIFEHTSKVDLIDKLRSYEYKVRGSGQSKSDHIQLTMDKETWQELYNNHLDQIQAISDSRLNVHQYTTTLVKKFEVKYISYCKSEEFPNFVCNYYSEDFERIPI
jgi:UDP-galactopyranose mutase